MVYENPFHNCTCKLVLNGAGHVNQFTVKKKKKIALFLTKPIRVANLLNKTLLIIAYSKLSELFNIDQGSSPVNFIRVSLNQARFKLDSRNIFCTN